MSQQHDFAIVLAELFQSSVEPFEELMSNGFGRRRQALVA